MAKRIINEDQNNNPSQTKAKKPNGVKKKQGVFKGLKQIDRKKILSQAVTVGLILVVGIGAMAGMGLLPHTDKRTGKKYSWFRKELPKTATNLWNPFASPPVPTAPSLSKEYIYAGDRMLAIEDYEQTP